jgi:hypothetical protein
MERCANTEYLNAHMRTVDREEKRIDAIYRRKDQLLDAHYALDPGLVLEALGEASDMFGAEIFTHLSVIEKEESPHIKSAFYEHIGRLVARQIDSYRYDLASRMAYLEIDNAACQHCYDEGCPKCREE